MKQVFLFTSLTLALGLLILQLPNSVYTAMSNAVLSVAAGGALSDLSTEQEYGERLGIEVDAAVNNIHARIPNSEITHADVLTVMCMESAGLIGRRETITSGAGARGMTQVMPETLAYYANGDIGGFYLDNRPDLLYSDSRFSIEAGALIFNHHLMNYVPRYGPLNGRTVAAIAYNGGPGRVGLPKSRLPRETRDYAYNKLPNCFNQIRRGTSPVNSTIWRAMVSKVWELTDGKMSLDGAPGVPSDVMSQSTTPASTISRVQEIAQRWWESPQARNIQRPGPPPQTVQRAGQYAPQVHNTNNDQDDRQSWLDRLIYRDRQLTKEEVSSIECKATDRGVKIKWSCPSGSTITKGYAPDGQRFDTNGANTGAIHAIDAPSGEYKIVCVQSHKVLSKATCNVD
jgi:hypothetical protein